MVNFSPLTGMVEKIHKAVSPVLLALVPNSDTAHKPISVHVGRPSIRGVLV